MIQEKLFTYSENAQIFILLHKIDYLKNTEHVTILKKYRQTLEGLTGKKEKLVQVFMTTLWNESLYKAWS